MAVGQAVPVVLPGPADDVGRAPTSARCATSSPRTGCGPTTCARVIDALADTGSVLELRRRLRPRAWSPRWSASRAGRSGIIANNPTHLGRRHRRRRRRQGGPLPAAVRRLRPAAAVPVRHAGDHGRARGREDGAGAPRAAGMFVTGRQPHRAVRARSSCARATASAPRPWPAAASRRRCSAWPGRPASSAAWASRARCGSATARSSRPSRTPPSASALFEEMVARMYEHGKALNTATLLRDRRRHRPGRLPPLDRRRPRRRPPHRPPRTGKKRPIIDTW